MKITDVEAIYVRLPEVKEQISPSADGRSRDCGISMTGSNFFTRSYALGYVISPRGAVHVRNVSCCAPMIMSPFGPIRNVP